MTPEQITTAKTLRRLAGKFDPSSLVVGALNAAADEIERLQSSEQALREEVDLLTKHCETQDKMLTNISMHGFDAQMKLNQAIEVLKEVDKLVIHKDVRDFLSSLGTEEKG